MDNPRYILGVDPSIRATGWAVVGDDAPKESRSRFCILGYGTITTNPESSDFNRVATICRGLTVAAIENGPNAARLRLFGETGCDEAVVESAKRWTREGRNVGSLQALATSYGAILATLHTLNFQKVTTRAAAAGKQGGLATKGGAKKRLGLFFNEVPRMSSHAADATMLAIWGHGLPRI